MGKDLRKFSEVERKAFFKEVVHRQRRRARWHDYTSRCFYMVTLNKNSRTPDLSRLVGSLTDMGDPPRVELTTIGALLTSALSETVFRFPMFRVCRQVFMPDHVHLVIQISCDDSPHLGTIIGFFSGRATHKLREFTGNQEAQYFEKNFHDLIVYGRDQLRRFNDYVSDNPRRLMIKRLRPDLFTAQQMLTSNECSFHTKGNFFLLRHPLRIQVRFSRRFTAEEWEERCRSYMRVIAHGGVLVSPFIHPNEREILKLGIENGAGIIYLVNNGFRERSAPHGGLFDLCAKGRALIIAPPAYEPTKKDIRRVECMELNSWARLFAEKDPEYTLKGGRR